MKRFSVVALIIGVVTAAFLLSNLSCERKSQSGDKLKKETPEVLSIFDPTVFYAPPLRLPEEFKIKTVEAVLPNGNLKLTDGNEIGYAGIILADMTKPIFGELLNFIWREVGNKEILIAYDPRIETQEKGLAYIFYDIPPELRTAGLEMKSQGKMLNKELLEQGLARVDQDTPFRYKKEFSLYENKAKMGKKGVWGKSVSG
ncbi:MAG: thermonuclease family protein [Candidatus Omnitrophica bacterium]|nr:thermonuclease family protein [Candidatus Omnitrophota bacterium]